MNPCYIVAGSALAVTSMVWLYMTALIFGLHGSDPAGNAISLGLAQLSNAALWVLLAVLLFIAGLCGTMPWPGGVLAVILVPASGFAASLAIRSMGSAGGLVWPAVIPVVIPIFIAVYCIWCLFPSMRSHVPSTAMTLIVWGLVVLLSSMSLLARDQATAIRLANQARYEHARLQETQQQQAQTAQTFQSLTPDSSLQDWWRYTEPGDPLRQQALAGARHSKSRHWDIFAMLDDGKRSVFHAIPDLDLAATPELEQAIRRYLQTQLKRLMLYDPIARPAITTAVVVEWNSQDLPTLRWLVEQGRSCNAELDATAAAVAGYPDTPQRAEYLAALRSLHRTAE